MCELMYELKFDERALKEWQKLGDTIKTQFKKRLAKVLQNLHIIANRLSGGQNLYKINFRSAGYRLVYQVEDDKVVVFVIVMGEREKNAVYDTAEEWLAERQSDNQDTQSVK
ncbi:type II toxin-antitoxin system RelE family toxin [Moraxella bovis]|uniref:mRNA interferase RelE n=1 Tax=Moraxella bovis TaxID=476 RepID=A0A378PWS3_MORBO|nr:type II toxin-antitoxin system RelE/ParE family toxin [Moraxella bovis]STY93021.1 mRNA interferase RelE [Moraxella bovis]